MSAKFKTGLVSISFRPLSTNEIVQLVADAGLEGIEWGGDVHVPHGDLEVARATRELTRDAGLEVAAYGSYYRFDDCIEDSDETGPNFDAVLDTAEALGAPSIRVWAGRKNASECSDLEIGRIADRTREIAEQAARRGIRIDYEFHDNTATHTNESTVDLLDRVDHPNAWTLWQTALQVGHAYRSRGLETLLDRISNIHCNYFGENGWPDQFALSEGTEEWADYLKILNRSDRSRWILIEHVKNNAVESFRDDAATLRRWLAGGDR